jgi:hypothetical protein
VYIYFVFHSSPWRPVNNPASGSGVWQQMIAGTLQIYHYDTGMMTNFLPKASLPAG